MDGDSLCFAESKESVGLREFFRLYENRLPQLLLVAQGFYATSDLETLSTGQVIFVPSYVKQSRVLAEEVSGKGRVISLPVSYPVLFAVTRVSAQGQKQHGQHRRLVDILAQNPLPVDVDMIMTSDPIFVSGPNGETVGAFSTLRLTEVFQDTFLVGHGVEPGEDHGRLYTRPFPVPLYMGQVLVTPLVKAQGVTPQRWHQVLLDMAARVQRVKSKVPLVNPDIVVYSSSRRHSKTAPVHASENVYESLMPVAVVSLQERGRTKDTVGQAKDKGGSVNIKGFHLDQSVREMAKKIDEPREQTPAPDYAYSSLAPNRGGQLRATDEPLPRCRGTDSYIHPVPPSEFLGRNRPSSTADGPPRGERPLPLPPGAAAEPWERRMKSLSISQLSEKLRELRLERYQGAFKEQLVDGAILSQLHVPDLKSEFNMTTTEAIRLRMFVTEGHIPK